MLLSTLLLAAVAIAAPTSRLVVHEKRSSPLDHAKRERIDGDAIIPVRIALAQRNLDKGYAYLMEVSDPHSVNYGKHWSVEEIHAEFAPSDDTIEAVKLWLEELGFHRDDIAESASRGWLGVDMPVHQAESLFDTEYYEHEDEDGAVRIGCDRYRVPSHLSAHIDHLKPGIMISAPINKVKSKCSLKHARRDTEDSKTKIPYISPTSTANCGEYITPACLKALYGIPDAKFNHPENVLGVFESFDAYDQTDLDLFFSNYAPWVPNGTHPTLVSVNNAKAPVPVNSTAVQGESIVDFDLAFSLLYPQDITLYQVQPTSKQTKLMLKEYGKVGAGQLLYIEPFLDALDGAFCTKTDREAGADCGTIELTRVLSMSYGVNELSMPEAAAKRACAEYMKYALKGHTIVVASGDNGPAGYVQYAHGASKQVQNGCINPSHLDSVHYNGTIFNPQFPAVCPFVTTVGGTQLNRKATVQDSERAMYIHSKKRETPYPDIYTFSTSGGISNYFPMPDYQRCAIEPYFKNHDPGYPTYKYTGHESLGSDGGIYASGGRAFPDVAANAAHLAVYVLGSFFPQGETGTSLSAPIFASIMTMINQERTNAGKGPVGFINPVMYKHPEVFNDITLGSAPGCHTPGFSAVEGWDPTTGLGTPKYRAMLELFMGLP